MRNFIRQTEQEINPQEVIQKFIELFKGHEREPLGLSAVQLMIEDLVGDENYACGILDALLFTGILLDTTPTRSDDQKLIRISELGQEYYN